MRRVRTLWTLWVVGGRGLRRIRVGWLAVAGAALVLGAGTVGTVLGARALLGYRAAAREGVWLRQRLGEKRALIRRQREELAELAGQVSLLRRDMGALRGRVQEMRHLARMEESDQVAPVALPVVFSDGGVELPSEPTATALEEIGWMRSVAASVGDSLALMSTLLADRGLRRPALPAAWPLRGAVSSEFGARRSPYHRGPEMHPGIDIVGPYGARVVASGDGEVVYAGWDRGYGRVLVIDHGGGLESLYAHLARITVHRGDHVHRGQRVAAVGRTGRATGAHLHYEVRVNGEAIDPRCYLR